MVMATFNPLPVRCGRPHQELALQTSTELIGLSLLAALLAAAGAGDDEDRRAD
jgi:hypothetical protein